MTRWKLTKRASALYRRFFGIWLTRTRSVPTSAPSTMSVPDRSDVTEAPTPARVAPPWGSIVIIIVMILGGLALETTDGRHVHLSGWPQAVLPEICWSQRWLGWSCPLCGATRSVILLVRGQWTESWNRQPAGVLVLLAATISAGISWIGYVRGPRSGMTVSVLTQSLWVGIFMILVVRHAWIAAGWSESASKLPRTHASAPAVR